MEAVGGHAHREQPGQDEGDGRGQKEGGGEVEVVQQEGGQQDDGDDDAGQAQDQQDEVGHEQEPAPVGRPREPVRRQRLAGGGGAHVGDHCGITLGVFKR